MATNAGAFLSDDAPKWQEALLSSFDLFTIWSMILMAIGYSAINPKKISYGKALGTIVLVWAILCSVQGRFLGSILLIHSRGWDFSLK